MIRGSNSNAILRLKKKSKTENLHFEEFPLYGSKWKFFEVEKGNSTLFNKIESHKKTIDDFVIASRYTSSSLMKMKKSNESSSSLEDNATIITVESDSDHNDDNDDNFIQSPKTLRRRHQTNENPPSKVSNDNREAECGQIHPQHEEKPNPFMLLICASGICACFLYYGIIQERLFSKNSKSAMKSCGNTATFNLVLSCITNVFVAYGWIWAENKLSRSSLPTSSKKVENKKDQMSLNHKLFFRCKFFIMYCFFILC